jgi:proline racemase
MKKAGDFTPPDHWLKIRTIDMHTGGEPLRVILDGFPVPEGQGVLDYRRYYRDHLDHLRTALMFEPRGHADMYGVIITPSQVADFGVVFIHNEGYSTMCGHATIAIGKLAVEAGWVERHEGETQLTIEAPCGILTVWARVENSIVTSVRFHNVPSYVVALDQHVDIPGLGKVNYDLAYGGAYYAFVNADKLGILCTPDHYRELIEKGMEIKHAVMQSRVIDHPYEADLGFLYGTIFIGGPVSKGVDSRNVCIFAEGEVDRSPTGSGVSARMAIHYAKGEVQVGESMLIESILGTTFRCKVNEVTTYGNHQAVIPEVEGTAYYTGQNEFWIDTDDPLKQGFMLR